MSVKDRKTKVLLVSDHLLFRQALARVITQEESNDGPSLAVEEASGTDEALEQVKAKRPDIVLLHLGKPGAAGIQTLHKLQEVDPELRVIVLLDVVDDGLMSVALQAGAAGYIDGSVDVAHLLAELRDVANGDIAMSKGLARLIATMFVRRNGHGGTGSQLVLEPPTPRELRVLELVSLGLTNGAVAKKLLLSESTVRAHVRSISQKLGTRNRVQAVARALELGILSPTVASEGAEIEQEAGS